MPWNISNFSAPQVDLVGQEDDGQQGAYVIPKNCAVSTAGIVPPQNSLYVVRFRPGRTFSVQSVCVVVTTASATNDNGDVGIWSGTGTLLGSAGSTAGKLNVAGVSVFPLTTAVTLSPGSTYYVGFAYGASAAPGTLAAIVSPLSNNAATQVFGAAYPAAELAKPTITGVPISSNASPLPAYAAVGTAPLLAVREY
jgi:hypothetical protein